MDAYTSDYMIDGNQMAIVGEQLFMYWDNRVHCSGLKLTCFFFLQHLIQTRTWLFTSTSLKVRVP